MKKSSPKKSKLAQRYDDKLPRRQKALEGARKFLFDEEDFDGSKRSDDSSSFNGEERFSLIPRSRKQWRSQLIPSNSSSLDIGSRIEEEDETKKCFDYDWTRRVLLAFVPTILALLIVTGTIIFRKGTKHGSGKPNGNGGSFVPPEIGKNETPVSLDEIDPGASVPQENGKNETQESLDGTDSNITDNSRFDIMFESLVGYSDHKMLSMQGSPQNKALRWLSDYDTSQIDPYSEHVLERYVLATLFFATNTDLQPHDTVAKTNSDLGWRERSEWLSGRGICMWYGVECPHRIINGERTARYDQDADIMKLLLGNNNIHGTLPDEITILDSMKVFDFSMNNIDSTSLLLATNFGYLEILNLRGNQVAAATIPDEISRFSHLRSLDISSTRLEGSIPEGIGALSRLEVIDMADNMLVGKLPEFSGLDKLTKIDLSENDFEGTVPAQYGSLSSLVELHLQGNKLDGTVPESICTLTESANLKNLTINCRTDEKSVGNHVECSCCSSSLVPQENEKNETSVSLDGTDLNITDNSRFDIMFESLVGYSDHKMLSMQGSPQNKALRWLSDYDTSQIDPYSEHVLERYVLATLFFATNTDLQPHDTVAKTNSDLGWRERSEWLSGRGICMWYGVECPHRIINGERTARYDQDADIMKLLLGNNNIHGTLPDEITILDSMKVFDFSMNNIDSTSLLLATNFGYLEILNLRGNQVAAATIPDEISRFSHLRSLDISSTRLEGSIPEGIGALSRLEVIDMADNMLVGKLPEFSGLDKLTKIDLSENDFEGTVPAQYGSLSSLVELHLQGNKLDGTVPESICTLTESANLKNLTIHCSTDEKSVGNHVECSCCSTCSP